MYMSNYGLKAPIDIKSQSLKLAVKVNDEYHINTRMKKNYQLSSSSQLLLEGPDVSSNALVPITNGSLANVNAVQPSLPEPENNSLLDSQKVANLKTTSESSLQETDGKQLEKSQAPNTRNNNSDIARLIEKLPETQSKSTQESNAIREFKKQSQLPENLQAYHQLILRQRQRTRIKQCGMHHGNLCE